MGFGPPEGDPMVWATLQEARAQDAMTFALPGMEGSYALEPATEDPFMHQEMIEILYHTLWETVHVFFEHRELGHDRRRDGVPVSLSGPREASHRRSNHPKLPSSIQMKVDDDSELRVRVAREQSEQISSAALAIQERLQRGGKLILFGNGGSATDANDWAIDCVASAAGLSADPRRIAVNGASQHHRRRQ